MSTISNIQILKEKITEEDIKKILLEYNINLCFENDQVIVFPTACHNINPEDGSPKLYYYKNSKMFYCFTECNKSYDIISLLIQINKIRGKNLSFWDIIDYLAEKINYNEESFEILEQKIYSSNRSYYNKNKGKIPFNYYNNDILNFFSFYLPYEWAKEGITYQNLTKYNIRYYPAENQIVIPHYDINKKLVGIRIRALNKEDIVFGKYRPLKLENKIYSHPLSQFCYGLWNNKENIAITKKAVIVEGEKSVLKGEKLEYNNLVACCGSNISKVQIQQLIECGAKEIVIAFDKEYKNRSDKKNEIYYNKLYEIANKYKLYCNISFIFDFENILKEKDSPIDNGIEKYNYLLERRVKLYE